LRSVPQGAGLEAGGKGQRAKGAPGKRSASLEAKAKSIGHGAEAKGQKARGVLRLRQRQTSSQVIEIG